MANKQHVLLNFFITTATILLLFKAVAIFSAPQPIRRERQAEDNVPLRIRINKALIALKDLVLTLFPYATEPTVGVCIPRSTIYIVMYFNTITLIELLCHCRWESGKVTLMSIQFCVLSLDITAAFTH